MIQISRPTLSNRANSRLSQYQTIVISQIGFPSQVAFAKSDFPTKNVIGNATFAEVKQRLVDSCCGAERCHYCEDSKADEVEHLLPKDVYPDLCYNWNNYFYSCGSCNTKKSNKCAVISPVNGHLIINTPTKRRRNQPPLPPPLRPATGQQAFINLHTENPLDFFLLDIKMGSFEFSEYPSIGTPDYLRAKFTLETLKLNKRAFLRKARKQAYGDFKARLTEYIYHVSIGSPISLTNIMIDEIKTHGHPTVWKEMIRQRNFIPELKILFRQAPLAIHW